MLFSDQITHLDPLEHAKAKNFLECICEALKVARAPPGDAGGEEKEEKMKEKRRKGGEKEKNNVTGSYHKLKQI